MESNNESKPANMKTVKSLLENAYNSLQEISKSNGDSAVARRDLYLALEEIKESAGKVAYFYNEKGDYTITLREQPIAVALTEADAMKLVNHINSLTLRIDVLTKIKDITIK